MPLMRRRPLARAAMVGGTAYVAGKHVAAGQQQEAEQEAQIQLNHAPRLPGKRPPVNVPRLRLSAFREPPGAVPRPPERPHARAPDPPPQGSSPTFKPGPGPTLEFRVVGVKVPA